MKTDKAELLESALKLFNDCGFRSVTISDIGAAVGVTGAALYRHFRSKGDVLGQLCEMTLNKLTECTGPVRDDPREELEALVRGQVHLVIQYPRLLTVTLAEGRALEDPWRGTIQRRQRGHLRRWKTTVAALHTDKDTFNIDLAVYGAIGLINSAARWPPSLKSRPDFERRLTSGAYLIIDTLIKSDPSEDDIPGDEGTLFHTTAG
jgi:AcrR family transcriptional regulator